MKPYSLKAGESWTYDYGIPHHIKLGELMHGRGASVLEFNTRKGEEPPDHTHGTEDELFYVLKGEVAFHCGGEVFDVKEAGFMFLPKGVEHGYMIKSDGDVKLLVITFPTQDLSGLGWGGYVADVESEGEKIASPSGLP